MLWFFFSSDSKNQLWKVNLERGNFPEFKAVLKVYQISHSSPLNSAFRK